MTQPSVFAIVLTYNGSQIIGRMLKSLRETDYSNLKVLVVDNGSSDGSDKLVQKEFPEVELMKFEKNQGFSGANNKATEHVLKTYSPDYLIWLNDDMEIVDKGWLTKMIETAERTGAGITGCKLILSDGRIQYAGGFFDPIRITYHRGLFETDTGQYDDEREVDYANGACFMVKKEVFEKIGLLDVGYNPIYFEEADFCARAKKAGFRIIYTGKAKLIHHTGVTAKKEKSKDRYYVWEKNRIRFIEKNFSPLWKALAYARIYVGVLLNRKESMTYGTTVGERFELLKKAKNESKLGIEYEK